MTPPSLPVPVAARRRLPRPARLVLALAPAYVVLEWLFARAVVHEGLLTPGGSPRAGVVALGVACVVARVAARFGIPAAVAFAVVSELAPRARCLRPRA